MDSKLPFYDWINFLFSSACLRLFVCFFFVIAGQYKISLLFSVAVEVLSASRGLQKRWKDKRYY